MNALLLALCLAASMYGVAIANESQHSVIVDMPAVANLSHASPDTWDTLPQQTLMFAQDPDLMTSRSSIDTLLFDSTPREARWEPMPRTVVGKPCLDDER